MNINTLLVEDLCQAHITLTSKKELLTHCAQCIACHPAANGVSEVLLLRELQKRERKSSTGFGHGVAIPHARIDGMHSFVFFILTSKEGIAFNAVDNLPVKLFLILVGPEESVQEHIKILALLSRTLCKEGVKEQLIAYEDAHSLAQRFKKELVTHVTKQTHKNNTPPIAKGGVQMALLLINVYEEDYLQQVLESLLEYDIDGATIIDSSGMGQFLSAAPLFGNFIGCMHQNKYHSKTIIAVANLHRVEPLFDEIENNLGNKEPHEAVSLLAMQIHTMRGSMSVV